MFPLWAWRGADDEALVLYADGYCVFGRRLLRAELQAGGRAGNARDQLTRDRQAAAWRWVVTEPPESAQDDWGTGREWLPSMWHCRGDRREPVGAYTVAHRL